MRDRWYADSRDTVKWGTAVHLARRHHIRSILHIAFFRPDRTDELLEDGANVGLPNEVWDHFRDIRHVRQLGRRSGLQVLVFDRPFDPQQRQEYVESALARLSRIRGARIVLLDPDTGIEPNSGAPKHVKIQEVERFWRALRARDWLLLYQHKSRAANWLTDAQQKFKAACSQAKVRTFTAPQVAADVAILAVSKGM